MNDNHYLEVTHLRQLNSLFEEEALPFALDVYTVLIFFDPIFNFITLAAAFNCLKMAVAAATIVIEGTNLVALSFV